MVNQSVKSGGAASSLKKKTVGQEISTLKILDRQRLWLSYFLNRPCLKSVGAYGVHY